MTTTAVPTRNPIRQVAEFKREHPRGWTLMAAALLAGLSLLIGLGATVYDGLMNPLPRARIFFVIVGVFAFYLPGLLVGYAAFGLRRGRVSAVRAGAFAALGQGLLAAVVTPAQLLVLPLSVPLLVQGAIWTAFDLYVAWLLWRGVALGRGRRGGDARVRGGRGPGCRGGRGRFRVG